MSSRFNRICRTFCTLSAKRTPLAARDRGPGSEQDGPARVAKCPHERRSGARGRYLFAHLGNPRGGGWLIPAEAPGRFDRLAFVEVVDGLQRLGGGAFLKAFGQDLEPRPILGLKGEEDGDSLVPALGTASTVGRSPVMDHRQGRGAGGAMPGLPSSTYRTPNSRPTCFTSTTRPL